jgi:hypothetical protein
MVPGAHCNPVKAITCPDDCAGNTPECPESRAGWVEG